MIISLARLVGGKLWQLSRTGLLAVVRHIDEMVSKFAERFVLTAEEQKVVIDDKEGALFRNTKVFLVGKVLTSKTFNKQRFKRQMLNLRRPKAKVTIVELDEGLFSFGFDNIR